MWLSGLFVIAIIALGAASLWVDPAKLRPPSQRAERELATRLAKGEPTGVRNEAALDLRLVERTYADIVAEAPEVLVLGTSAVRGTDTSMLGERRVHTAHVPGAQLEDLLWLTDRYAERGLLPKTVVVGMSPWALLGDEDLSWRLESWRRYADGVLSMRRRLGDVPVQTAAVLNLDRVASWWGDVFAPAHLRAAMVSPRAHVVELTEPEAPDLLRLVYADGSHAVAAQLRHRPADEIREEALEPEVLEGVETLLSGLPPTLDSLDRSRLELFERYLAWLTEQGVEVVLLRPPMHPAVYAHLSERFGLIQEMNEYIARVANEQQIGLAGDYDPQASGCTTPMFIDAFHYDRSCAMVLFALAKSRGAI